MTTYPGQCFEFTAVACKRKLGRTQILLLEVWEIYAKGHTALLLCNNGLLSFG